MHFILAEPMESVVQRRGIKAIRGGGKNVFTLRELDMLFCHISLRHSEPTITEGVREGMKGQCTDYSFNFFATVENEKTNFSVFLLNFVN